MIRKIVTTASVLLVSTLPAAALVEWDADADGALNPDEFVAGFASAATFAKFDVDASGQLSAEEWDAGLTGIGEYANMDLNGDGAVDESEYNALLFNRYDTDGSGVIEATEIAQVEADLGAGGMLAP